MGISCRASQIVTNRKITNKLKIWYSRINGLANYKSRNKTIFRRALFKWSWSLMTNIIFLRTSMKTTKSISKMKTITTMRMKWKKALRKWCKNTKKGQAWNQSFKHSKSYSAKWWILIVKNKNTQMIKNRLTLMVRVFKQKRIMFCPKSLIRLP